MSSARWSSLRGRAFPALALALAVAATGCSSSAPVRLHTLLPASPPAAVGVAPSIAIVLSPIRLPEQVDQPQWVVRLPDESLLRLEQERWASPLRDELRQALLERLALQFGATEGRTVAGSEPTRVSVEVRRFESIPGREARIEGAWQLQSGADVQARCTFQYREASTGGPPIDTLAAAHRKAVERLGDAIGNRLLRRAGACEPPDPR